MQTKKQTNKQTDRTKTICPDHSFRGIKHITSIYVTCIQFPFAYFYFNLIWTATITTFEILIRKPKWEKDRNSTIVQSRTQKCVMLIIFISMLITLPRGYDKCPFGSRLPFIHIMFFHIHGIRSRVEQGAPWIQ